MNKDLNFDIRGNLKPYDKVKLRFEEFEEFFVRSFDTDSSRHEIFENYKSYTINFQEKVSSKFTQWINGSFATNKMNPKDIDLVNLLDYRVVEEKETVIRSEFIKENVPKNYKIDAYLLILYPEDHRFHVRTRSDLLYWNDWFTKSRMNKMRKRYPKGYIEIEFG